MMKKTYKIDVDGANFANKMQDAAKDTGGVKDSSVKCRCKGSYEGRSEELQEGRG